eukprot:scaffold96259_cov44-Tisochrysis_lutea.AAC.2
MERRSRMLRLIPCIKHRPAAHRGLHDRALRHRALTKPAWRHTCRFGASCPSRVATPGPGAIGCVKASAKSAVWVPMVVSTPEVPRNCELPT